MFPEERKRNSKWAFGLFARKARSEASFTLLETMVALGIIATVIAQVAGVNANAAYFSDYGRKSIQAVWLAKRVMTQIEYHWLTKDFKDLLVEQEKLRFDGMDEYDEIKEFTYDIAIVEWKLPLMQLITSVMGGGSMDDPNGSRDQDRRRPQADPQADAMSGMIEGVIKQILSDDLLKVAHVKVHWPEGARRNSETLTLLLTNQRKIDEVVSDMKALTGGPGTGTTGGDGTGPAGGSGVADGSAVGVGASGGTGSAGGTGAGGGTGTAGGPG